MRTRFALLALISVTFPQAGLAQAGTDEDPNAIVSALAANHHAYKQYILETLDVVPEDLFEFRPSDDVYTIGEQLVHIAGANYNFCSSAAREDNPLEERIRRTRTTKAQIADVVIASFDYCDGVYDRTTDDMLTAWTTFNGVEYRVASVLTGNTAHVTQHYGNLITYMRINGIVPPSSRPH